MRTRLTRIFVLAVSIAGLLTACAQGTDEDPSPDGALTKPEFIAQADARCAEADAETKELRSPQKPAEVEPFVDKARAITQELVDDLRELPAPEGDQQTIDAMLDTVEEALQRLPALVQASKDKDLAAVQAEGQKLQALAQEAQQIAEEYGFEVCGRAAPPAPAP